MKTILGALEIELILNKKNEPYFSFNNTTLRAIQSGLGALYEEVFICASHPRLVVMAAGCSTDFLILTFSHHRQHYKKMVVHENEKAIQFLQDIVDGRIWRDCSFTDKLNAFQFGYDSSIELSGLGSQLTPIVKGGLTSLSAKSMAAGGRNTLYVNNNKAIPSFEKSNAFPERFYGFYNN